MALSPFRSSTVTPPVWDDILKRYQVGKDERTAHKLRGDSRLIHGARFVAGLKRSLGAWPVRPMVKLAQDKNVNVVIIFRAINNDLKYTSSECGTSYTQQDDS